MTSNQPEGGRAPIEPGLKTPLGSLYEAFAAGLFLGQFLSPLYVIWRRRDPDHVSGWIDFLGALALISLVIGVILHAQRPKDEHKAIRAGLGLCFLALLFPACFRLLRYLVGW